METSGRLDRALPWLIALGVSRKGALWVLRERAIKGSRNSQRDCWGQTGISAVFKTASGTDGFPGSICTEGGCR